MNAKNSAIALVLLPLLCAGAATAQEKAAEATNFSLGLIASDSDTADSTSNGTFGFTGTGTIPLGSWIGLSATGDYQRSTARTRDVLGGINSTTGTRPSCQFDSSSAELSLFVRRPAWGKVAGTYGTGRLSADCGEDSVFVTTGEDKLQTDSYRVDVEAYVGDFTVAASRTSTDLEDGPRLESNLFSATWYPLDSLRVSLSGGDLYDDDTYGIELEHQPEFMGNGLSAVLGYSVLDRASEVRTISFAVVYHFGTKVELKTRDRQYR